MYSVTLTVLSVSIDYGYHSLMCLLHFYVYLIRIFDFINILCSIHIRTEEKISLTAGREGGLQNLEVHGLITLKITNEKYGRLKIAIRNNDTKGAQLQVSSAEIIVVCCRIGRTYE